MTARLGPACTAALAAIAVAGCGNEPRSDETSGSSSLAPATQGAGPGAPRAGVAFAAPADGAAARPEFTARVVLENFVIDPEAIGKSPRPGRGHLHFQLDGGRYDRPEHSGDNGRLAVKLGVDGRYSPALAPEITYTGIPPGEHTLRVYLANNNHTDTRVEAETAFTVR